MEEEASGQGEGATSAGLQTILIEAFSLSLCRLTPFTLMTRDDNVGFLKPCKG